MVGRWCCDCSSARNAVRPEVREVAVCTCADRACSLWGEQRKASMRASEPEQSPAHLKVLTTKKLHIGRYSKEPQQTNTGELLYTLVFDYRMTKVLS